MKRMGAAAAGLAACTFAGAAAVVVVPLSCMPDLPADPVATSAAATQSCGDGIIELDAGEQCDPGPAAGDAGVLGCGPDCRVDCDGGFVWGRNDHCYELVTRSAAALQAATGSADSLCQQAGGHVVTFASNDEFVAVRDHFDAGIFWVGLGPARSTNGAAIYKPVAETLPEPGWSPACAGCYAYTADASAPLPVLVEPQADASSPSMNCIVASSDPAQSWQQYPCNTPLTQRRTFPAPGVICEREPVGVLAVPCEAGACFDLVATQGAKRYVYRGTQASPAEARADCATLGGRLVVLWSADEREQLWRELLHETVQPYAVWIGLTRPADAPFAGRVGPSAPSWQWEDGDPADAYPTEWGTAEPRPTVPGIASQAFLWQEPNEDSTLAHDDQSFSVLPYVCEVTSGAPEPGDDAGDGGD